jgi:hypothetical protein
MLPLGCVAFLAVISALGLAVPSVSAPVGVFQQAGPFSRYFAQTLGVVQHPGALSEPGSKRSDVRLNRNEWPGAAHGNAKFDPPVGIRHRSRVPSHVPSGLGLRSGHAAHYDGTGPTVGCTQARSQGDVTPGWCDVRR